MDVQCGIQVVLHKYSLVSGKIKSGTIEESTPAQLDLVESMQKRIDEIGEVGRVEGRRVERHERQIHNSTRIYTKCNVKTRPRYRSGVT